MGLLLEAESHRGHWTWHQKCWALGLSLWRNPEGKQQEAQAFSVWELLSEIHTGHFPRVN